MEGKVELVLLELLCASRRSRLGGGCAGRREGAYEGARVLGWHDGEARRAAKVGGAGMVGVSVPSLHVELVVALSARVGGPK